MAIVPGVRQWDRRSMARRGGLWRAGGSCSAVAGGGKGGCGRAGCGRLRERGLGPFPGHCGTMLAMLRIDRGRGSPLPLLDQRPAYLGASILMPAG